MILDHTHPLYKARRRGLAPGEQYNGAYYYSCEIVEQMIPNIKTDYNWVTVSVGAAPPHSIVFIHSNVNLGQYRYLKDIPDTILVCGLPETARRVKRYGTPIYLPLSVDVEYVKQFRVKKTKEVAFAGRPSKDTIYEKVDKLKGLERAELLTEMAKYKKVYAVGRTAIEAKILGCEVLPYDSRFPDPSIWKVLSNQDAAKILQEQLDKIDGS